MIFSLSSAENNLELPKPSEFDLICFFRAENAIHADESLWWKTLTASLKAKRGVLILDSNVNSFPLWDPSQRWQVGENWCWLTPRSLNIISDAYARNPFNFPDLKTFLINFKPS